jgi:hypothetical protein
MPHLPSHGVHAVLEGRWGGSHSLHGDGSDDVCLLRAQLCPNQGFSSQGGDELRAIDKGEALLSNKSHKRSCSRV